MHWESHQPWCAPARRLPFILLPLSAWGPGLGNVYKHSSRAGRAWQPPLWQGARAAAHAADEARTQQAALRGTLKGVTLRWLGHGRYVAPLLWQDGAMPWALALELQYAAAPPPMLDRAGRDNTFTLQYVLDGQAEVCASTLLTLTPAKTLRSP